MSKDLCCVIKPGYRRTGCWNMGKMILLKSLTLLKVLTEELLVPSVLKFLTFCGNQFFLYFFTTTYRSLLSSAIQHFSLIFLLFLGLLSGLFFSDFSTNVSWATRPAHPSTFGFIIHTSIEQRARNSRIFVFELSTFVGRNFTAIGSTFRDWI